MYKKHKMLMTGVLLGVGIFSFCMKIDYRKICSDAITISSISTAIYTALISSLVNSELKNKMMKPDKKISWKTQLGVLAKYLDVAVICSLANIIFSCLVRLYDGILDDSIVYRLLEAFGMATLAVVLMFTILMCRFIVNRQLWDE